YFAEEHVSPHRCQQYCLVSTGDLMASPHTDARCILLDSPKFTAAEKKFRGHPMPLNILLEKHSRDYQAFVHCRML
ncbi:unnamed protein product, partial [Ilex paraguariensis]